MSSPGKARHDKAEARIHFNQTMRIPGILVGRQQPWQVEQLREELSVDVFWIPARGRIAAIQTAMLS